MSNVDDQFEALIRGLTPEVPMVIRGDNKLYLDEARGDLFRNNVVNVSQRMRERLPSQLEHEAVVDRMSNGLNLIVASRSLPINVSDILAAEGICVYLWQTGKDAMAGLALEPAETLIGRLSTLTYGNYRVLDRETEIAIKRGGASNIDTHPAVGPIAVLDQVEILRNRGAYVSEETHERVYVPLAVEALKFYRAS